MTFSRSTSINLTEATLPSGSPLVLAASPSLAGGVSAPCKAGAYPESLEPADILTLCDWAHAGQPHCPILRQSSRAPWERYLRLH
jgi:hypothetical protein